MVDINKIGERSLYTVQEAAEILRCSKNHVYYLLKNLKMRGVNISPRTTGHRQMIRILGKDMIKFVEESSYTPVE